MAAERMDVLAVMDNPFELVFRRAELRAAFAELIEENKRLREIAMTFLPVMEAARPLVLNLERLRDATRAQGGVSI